MSNQPYPSQFMADGPRRPPVQDTAFGPPVEESQYDARMGPPINPDRFSEQLDGAITPPPRAPGMMGPPNLPLNDDPSIDGGPRTPTIFSDHLLNEMAQERGISMSPPWLDEDQYLGQRKGDNYSDELPGVWTDDFAHRPPLLTEGFPSGSHPTARTTMPEMWRGWSLEDTFPGHNESMPEGAIGYVGRDEARSWGTSLGPSMYPADMVDEDFIARREASPDFSPP